MGFGCNVPDKCWDREGRWLAGLLLLCSQILLCLSLGAMMRWEEKQHETASRLNYACLHLLTEDKSVRPLQCHHTHTHTCTHTDTCSSLDRWVHTKQYPSAAVESDFFRMAPNHKWSHGTLHAGKIDLKKPCLAENVFSRICQTWVIDPGDSGLCPICNQCAVFSFFLEFFVTVLSQLCQHG